MGDMEDFSETLSEFRTLNEYLIFIPIGYINENGHLNLKRFQKYLTKLSDVSNILFVLSVHYRVANHHTIWGHYSWKKPPS